MRRLLQAGQAESGLAIGCGAAVVIFVAIGIIGLMSFHPVDAGYVGVVTSFGKVQSDTLKPGMNILMPFVNQVTNVDTRVHGIPFGQESPFGAASSEYQDVFLTGTLNVHIDQNKAVDLYQNVGLDYDQKLVVPFFNTAIKEVVPQYHIGDILANREKIRQQTVVKLAAKLAPYGIIVDDVAISNIDFSPEYKNAVEAKQVAAQAVETENNVLAQKKIQAEEIKVTAQANADAVVIAATAQAAANAKLDESLTDQLVQYTLVQKLAPNVQTIVLPSGQSFILDPKSLVKPAQ